MDPRDMESLWFFSPSYMRNQDIVATYNPNQNRNFCSNKLFIPIPCSLTDEAQNPFIEGDAEKNAEALGAVVDTLWVKVLIGQNLYRALDNRDVYGKVITDRGAPNLQHYSRSSPQNIQPGF